MELRGLTLKYDFPRGDEIPIIRGQAKVGHRLQAADDKACATPSTS